MMSVIAFSKAKQRRIALFPGAFRPPHRAHYATVVNLASRADIDEVVVIITNRTRHVPGTTKTLDTDIAEKIWAIYLQAMPKVRVEVAPYSAVKRAISYFERVNPGDQLLFYAGESELDFGRGRFSKVNALSQKFGISAQVVASPVPSLMGGATAVRACLTKGDAGFEEFKMALPDHLSALQYEEVWQICQQGMQEMQFIACKRIRSTIAKLAIGEIESISHANTDPDAIHCVQLNSGKRVFVKYANDTVKAARLGRPLSLKPRARLYAERRALKWLSHHNDYKVEIPQVIYFENKVKTLVLSEILPGKRFLNEDFTQGIFDSVVAGKIGELLACWHRSLKKVPPFWGDKQADQLHWENLLDVRTLATQAINYSNDLNQSLDKLNRASKKAAHDGFFHLDLCPKNIRLDHHDWGIIDFELCSSVGDTACDFGFFLGHIVYWGVVTSSEKSCLQFLHTAISNYCEIYCDDWAEMSSRTIAFAGATIIGCLNNNQLTRKSQKHLLNIASMLLIRDLDKYVDVINIMHLALSKQAKHAET